MEIVLLSKWVLFTGLAVGSADMTLRALRPAAHDSVAASGKTDENGAARVAERTLKSGATLHPKSPAVLVLTEVTSGWLCRCKFANDGYRTILDFVLPGESFFSPQLLSSGETVFSVSDARLRETEYPLSQGQLFPPALYQGALVALLGENARLTERLVSIGRRDAFERIAYLFLELAYRSRVKQSGGSLVFDCPLTQTDIGDVLGLSTVHVNRVLKELRTRNLLSLRNGRVELFCLDDLAERVGFESDYLGVFRD